MVFAESERWGSDEFSAERCRQDDRSDKGFVGKRKILYGRFPGSGFFSAARYTWRGAERSSVAKKVYLWCSYEANPYLRRYSYYWLQFLCQRWCIQRLAKGQAQELFPVWLGHAVPKELSGRQRSAHQAK